MMHRTSQRPVTYLALTTLYPDEWVIVAYGDRRLDVDIEARQAINPQTPIWPADLETQTKLKNLVVLSRSAARKAPYRVTERQIEVWLERQAEAAIPPAPRQRKAGKEA